MNILSFTAQKNGGDIVFQCSDGTSLSTRDYNEAIEYLIKPCDISTTWSVDTFKELFCELIPASSLKELDEKGKIFLPMPCRQKIYYQAGRIFSINWGYGREINLYSVSYYKDDELTDVNDIYKFTLEVLDAYNQLGLQPTKLTSPVAAFGDKLNKIDFPRACDLPDKALPMIDACSNVAWEEWRELYKIGHWDKGKVTDFDLTAAYPWLMSKLPDIRKAWFIETDTMPERYSWGEMIGELDITKDVTPFYKLGKREASITTEHLWLINKYELGTFEMKHGWFFNLPRFYNYPFKEIMESLYAIRKNDNRIVSNIAKSISVGIGGKLAQRYQDGRLGDNYNSIYSRIITSRCQIKVCDFIWRHGMSKDVISVLVDGCLVEGKQDIQLENTGMGSWKADNSNPFLVLSLLYQWGGNKKPNGQTYDEIVRDIKDNERSSVFSNIDMNLMEYDRVFESLPRNGNDLLNNRYSSTPMMVEIA